MSVFFGNEILPSSPVSQHSKPLTFNSDDLLSSMAGLDEVSNDYDQENDTSYHRTISSSSFDELGTGLNLSQSIPENSQATEIEMRNKFKGLPLPQIILSTYCYPILRRE